MSDQEVSGINKFAFEFLTSYYAKQSKNSTLLVREHERTKEGAQADGLFVIRYPDDKYFAASLSTSHSDQLSSIFSQYKRKGLGKARFVTAAVLIITTTYAGYTLNHWMVLWVLPPVLALAGFLLHSKLELRHLKRRITSLVDELRQVPADEQWLAISVSSLCFKNNQLADKLVEACHHRRIGLITVGKRSRITLRLEPRRSTCRHGDFLRYYTAETAIRKDLSDQFMRVA
ncbi:hypothetical protein [Pontibacter roseus]|uniref:hypothetical protein n=1 Tax=Pontibacter roseus TaxID=336989 RepID=UPI00036333FF|nr:hypothetical protein [Pontibacter roseus]